MTKQELVKAIAKGAGITAEQSGATIDALLESITNELNVSGKSQVSGLGTFSLVTRAARTARNPRTGEPVDVPEKVAVKFKPAKGFGVE